MLPKKRRIPRKLFSELLVNSRYVNSPNFSLRFKIGQSIKETRIGVTVSKKVSKSAVVRNTIRRRAYSSISNLVPKVSHGLFLFVAKAGAEKLKGENLTNELQKLLIQSGQLS